MGKEDFLKNLKESLEKGEKNEEVVEHLNEIDKLADQITSGAAAEKLDKRVEESGVNEEMGEEERKKAEEEYAKILAKQKENDEKLRFLANIEQRNVEISSLKNEFESVKIGYKVKIQQLMEEKITLMAEFEKKYGTKAEEYTDFSEPDKEIE